ncbi:MAG: sialate O-acetylesterase [Kiritimatiellaeota bacterium]|nr:sialate O-acetylesterase [Kiritimatiellota bacterium]
MNRKLSLLVAVLLASPFAAHAEVKPHPLFTDGAVLQRDVSVPVWGKAKAGEKVTVEFRGQTATATADAEGNWKACLAKSDAGGPFTMVIRGENTITLTNVCVGEVWVCSGQSNMGFTLSSADNAAAAIAASADPQLRLFKVPNVTAETPQYSVKAAWAVAATNTTPSFTAVGYFFGRDLRKALGVPVGLIMTAWGGSYAEAWTDRATLGKVLPAAFDRYKDSISEKSLANYEKTLQNVKKIQANLKSIVAKAKAEGKPAPKPPRAPDDPRTTKNRPCVIFNAMLAPLQPFAIRGAIWYQGESNNGRAKEYQTLFPAMIGNWRQTWKLGDFPFFFVQIAPHQGQSPEIREAQFLTWQKTPNTAMAVITDHGEAADIHPKAKEPVGQRLALAARALTYGEKIEYSGPVFKAMKVSGDKAVLSFEHLGGGLVAKDGALKGFTVAGADKKFVAANAVIEGDTVVVSSAEVKTPAAVRFGWTNVPEVNLFNKADLPATPFRTDVE